MKFIDYIVAAASDSAVFAGRVRNLMKDGWVPIGGVCVAFANGGIWHYQAMGLPRLDPHAQSDEGY